MNRSVFLLVLLGCFGCGPAVLWRGRSPDRQHEYEVIKDGGIAWVKVDGQKRAGYQDIAAWSFVFSQDGRHHAYAARAAGSWRVVYDGRPGPAWDGIGEIVLSNQGRLAYSAERDGRWSVVVDGRPGPAFKQIMANTLRFSRHGAHYAYAGVDGHGTRVVTDSGVSAPWTAISQLQFSADEATLVYVARRGKRAHAVVNGGVSESAQSIVMLKAGDASTVAYAALTDHGWRVVFPGGVSNQAHSQVINLTLSSDGKHTAWVAKQGEVTEVYCDGQVLPWAVDVVSLVGFVNATTAPQACRVIYVANAGTQQQLVRHQEVIATHDEIGPIAQSPNGQRLAYSARDGVAWFAEVDGQEIVRGSWVSAPLFSGDGRRVAVLARTAGGMTVAVDGETFAFDLVLDGSFAFSRDGQRWAVLAGDLKRERLFFVVNGQRRGDVDLIELYSSAAQLTAQGLDADAANRIVQSWSQAEADKEAAKPPDGSTLTR